MAHGDNKADLLKLRGVALLREPVHNKVRDVTEDEDLESTIINTLIHDLG